MEGKNLGHRLKEDQTHKESHSKMRKNSYESLSKKSKLLFLSGLFDGEGSFGVWGKGKGRKSFQCSVEMCDKDIIQRFVDFFGGSILPVKVRKSNWKQTWKWKMSGKRAFASVGKMIEYMCQRRKDKYNVVKCDQIGG